jgi:outer membrane protein OmpA-like peptidoglycan-associated protein
MTAVTLRSLTAMLCVVLVVAGCSSADNDQAGQQTAPATTTQAPETTTSLSAECEGVVDDAQALLTEVGRFTTREATIDDVRTAASQLAASFDAAKTAIGPEAQADLDQAGQALQRIEDALNANPVDAAALRQAAGDFVAELGDAAAVCAGGAGPTTS